MSGVQRGGRKEAEGGWRRQKEAAANAAGHELCNVYSGLDRNVYHPKVEVPQAKDLHAGKSALQTALVMITPGCSKSPAKSVLSVGDLKLQLNPENLKTERLGITGLSTRR